MKDLHCHLLYNVDDGSKSLKSTLVMLKQAKDHGVQDIVLTPHFIENSKYASPKKNNVVILNSIKKISDYMNMNIYLGNEVFCSTNILQHLKTGRISTINNSRYMLVEIPLNTKLNNVKQIFFELLSNGIVPILAHPERYTAYYKDIDFFYELRTMGVLMQLNIGSLMGNYGRHEKKMAKQLLKYNLISFVGTDTHSETDKIYDDIEPALKIIKKIVGPYRYMDITEYNFDRVVNDEEI